MSAGTFAELQGVAMLCLCIPIDNMSIFCRYRALHKPTNTKYIVNVFRAKRSAEVQRAVKRLDSIFQRNEYLGTTPKKMERL